MKGFRYLGAFFIREGTLKREIGRRIGAAGVVLRLLYSTVEMKRELSQKAKVSIYQSVLLPSSTVITKRERLQMQVAEIVCLGLMGGSDASATGSQINSWRLTDGWIQYLWITFVIYVWLNDSVYTIYSISWNDINEGTISWHCVSYPGTNYINNAIKLTLQLLWLS